MAWATISILVLDPPFHPPTHPHARTHADTEREYLVTDNEREDLINDNEREDLTTECSLATPPPPTHTSATRNI